METLASRIARDGALKPMDAVGWAVRLTKSLERIHARKGVHGRVSPYCLMIELADCTSVGMLVDAERVPDLVAYHSPEHASGEDPKPSDDTWGVAVTLYEALAGKALFQGADDASTRAKILAAGSASGVALSALDEALRDILKRALARDWMERTNSVTALRRELEALRSATRGGTLMPLIEDTRKGAAPASMRMTQGVWPPRPPGANDDEDDDGPTLVASGKDIARLTRPKDIAAKSAALESAAQKAEEDEGQIDYKGLRSRLLGAKSASETPPPPSAREEKEAPEPLPAAAPAAEPGSEPLFAPDSEPPPAPKAVPPPKPASPPKPARPPEPARAPEPVWQRVPVQLTPAKGPPARAETPPDVAAEPRARGGSRWGLFIVLLVLAGGAAAAYRYKQPLLNKLNELRGQSTPSVETPTTPPTGAAQGTAAAPTESAAQSPAPSASLALSASAAAAPAPVGDVNACVRPLFPADTFTVEPMPDFAFLCQETDPRRGSGTLKTRIVAGKGGLMSDGMKEWALAGWYQLASFAVVRARCCPSAPPLSLPDAAGRCARVDQRLNELGAAAAATKDAKDAKLKEAMDNYTSSIHCMVRIGTTGAFTRHDNPQGGEDTAFLKMLSRVVASNK